MIRHFTSAPADPASRGFELGSCKRFEIQRTVRIYKRLVGTLSDTPVDIDRVGNAALAAIRDFSPQIAIEVEAMAEGAQVPPAHLGALNARTELFALCGTEPRGECTTAVLLPPSPRAPISVQTWDWHEELADSWFVWTIHYPDGRTIHTLTEYGIVAKIGVNSEGLGLHLNLLHHERDGSFVGLPVHVLARAVLEWEGSFSDVLSLISSARCSASSALTLVGYDGREASAITAEMSPLGPRFVTADAAGHLLHTNHFLSPVLATGDREWQAGPDSFLRLDILSRAVSGLASWDESSLCLAMASHFGGNGAICCHPSGGSPPGSRYKTLATASLDVGASSLRVSPGGPCEATEWWSPQKEVAMRSNSFESASGPVQASEPVALPR